jgi:protoporphyrinogen oxidase
MADLNERICIIGGGPAGVTAAMYLEKKGYKNYVIYEKDNRCGGKCYSPKVKMGPKDEERTVEMGAIMGAKTYYAVHEAELFGGESHEGGPAMSRIYRDSTGKEIHPFEVKKDFSFKKLHDLLKLKKAVKRLAKLMETKYAGYDVNGHRGIAEGRYDGLDKTYGNDMKHVEGTNPNLKDLALPFTEFCKLNKVEPVMRIWIAPFTSFGYGFFDEMAAGYVMKYLDVTTTIEFINTRLWTWTNGTQAVFEAVNKKLAHPAILETEVTKVERPEGGKVKVSIKGKEGEKVEEFDKLIVTIPLDRFAKMADASAVENELFGKIIHEEYVDFLAEFEAGKGPEISAYYFDNMVPERLGHAMVYYHRWHDLGKDCPCTVYALRNHFGESKVTYDYTIKTETEDMEKTGFPVKNRPIEWETYYCPHVSAKDYAAGWYDKLEAIQGQKNTYFGGEIICFGDMEETCEASKDLIGRFF